MKNSQTSIFTDASFRAVLRSAYPFFVLVLFPLLLGPGLYLTLTEAKFSFFTAATLAAVIPAFFAKKFSPVPKSEMPGKFLLLYTAWAFLSAFFSIYSWDSILMGQSRCDGLFLLCLYIIAFFVSLRSDVKTETIGKWMAVASFPLSVVAIIQEYGSPFLYPVGYTYRGVQFLSTVGHHDCFAGICSMMLPFFCCCHVLGESDCKKKAWGFLFPFASLFMMYSLLETGVDSGRVALLCTFCAVLPFLIDTAGHLRRFLHVSSSLLFAAAAEACIDITEKYVVTVTFPVTAIAFLLGSALCLVSAYLLKKKTAAFRLDPLTIRKAAYSVIAFFIAAALIFVFFYHGETPILVEFSELLHGRLDDHAGQLRGYIWKSSCKIVAEHPILGTGPGTFPAAFEPYIAGYMQLIPNTGVDMAHNDYLQIAACLGIPGLLLYLGFLIVLLTGAVRILFTRTSDKCCTSRLLPAVSGICAYLICCLFLSSNVIVSPLFWVLCGICARTCYSFRRPLPN